MKKTLTVLSLALIASVASAQQRTLTVGVFPDLDTVVKAAIPGFKKATPASTSRWCRWPTPTTTTR